MADKNRIRVVICSRRPILAHGLSLLMREAENLQIVASVGSIAELTERITTLHPDALLIDAVGVARDDRMLSGLRDLHRIHSGVSIVALLPPEEGEVKADLRRAGVSKCLPHNAAFDELAALIALDEQPVRKHAVNASATQKKSAAKQQVSRLRRCA